MASDCGPIRQQTDPTAGVPRSRRAATTFHDHEGSGTRSRTRSFGIMAGPRAGAEALVVERWVCRKSSSPLPGRGPHGRQRDREYRISRCAVPPGDVRLDGPRSCGRRGGRGGRRGGGGGGGWGRGGGGGGGGGGGVGG